MWIFHIQSKFLFLFKWLYFYPREWGEARCITALCSAEAEHNDCGGKKPQQSQGTTAWEPEARGPQPNTHKSCCTLVAF